jgi:5-methylcytosine-specific restriction endonuclease McrA
MTPKQKRAKKAQLVSIYGLTCWWCRCCLPAEEMTVEHLTPKSRGGSNNLENLRPACFLCNNSRGNSLYPPQRSFVPKSGLKSKLVIMETRSL